MDVSELDWFLNGNMVILLNYDIYINKHMYTHFLKHINIYKCDNIEYSHMNGLDTR